MSNIGDKMRYNIRDHLTDREVNELLDLFNKIKLDLSDDSFPTRTNRLEAVENMAKVLEIHGWKVIRDPDIHGEENTRFADALDHHQIMQKGVVR